MPKCFAIGIGIDEFWNMTPRDLRVYQECYGERQRYEADVRYEDARFMFFAFSAALANFSMAFSKTRRKPLQFEDYIERPSAKKQPKQLTEEDKQKQRELLMTRLMVMRSNFELNNGDK